MHEQNKLTQNIKDLTSTAQSKRAEAMGRASSDEMRQIVGLLYNQYINDFQLLDAIDIKYSNNTLLSSNKVKIFKALGSYITTALFLLFALLLSQFKDAEWIGLVLIGVAGIQIIIKTFFNIIQRYINRQLKANVSLSLNSTVEKHITEKRLQDLQNVEVSLERLLNSSKQTNADIEHIANLYTELYTMEKLEDASQLPYCKHLASLLLAQNNLTVIEYSDNNAKYFDTIESDMVELTIKPAILKEEVLIKKGMHYIKTKSFK